MAKDWQSAQRQATEALRAANDGRIRGKDKAARRALQIAQDAIAEAIRLDDGKIRGKAA